MKKSKRRNPIWPYLGILGCLFVLSLLAPCAWQRNALERPRSNAAHAGEPAPLEQASTPDGFDDEPVALEDAVPLEDIDDVEMEWERRDAELGPVVQADHMPGGAESQDFPYASSLEIIPPAPEFAQQVREEDLELAARPSLPEAPAPQEADERPEVPTPAPQAEAPPSPQLAEPASEQPKALQEAEPPSEPDYEPAVASSNWPVPRALVEQLTNLCMKTRS